MANAWGAQDERGAANLIDPAATLRGIAAVRTGLFLLVAVPFIGSRWQLYVGAVLFVVPQVLSIFENRFPNWPGVYAVLPRGILKTADDRWREIFVKDREELRGERHWCVNVLHRTW